MSLKEGLDQLEINLEQRLSNKALSDIPKIGSAPISNFSNNSLNLAGELSDPTLGQGSVWASINQTSSLPTQPAALDSLNYDLNPARISTATAKYNYYIQDYEESLLSSGVDEAAMLDVYGTQLILGNSEDLNSRLVQTRKPEMLRLPGNEDSVKNYFRNYAVNDVNENDGFENVIFASSQLSNFNSYAAAAEATTSDNFSSRYPFYITFNIDLVPSARFAEILHTYNRDNFLMRKIAATLESGDVYERKTLTRVNDNQSSVSRNKVWVLSELMDYEIQADFIAKNILLGTNEEDINSRGYGDVVDFSQLPDDIASGNEFLNIAIDQWSPDSNHTEVVGYRIAKYKIEDLNRPSQSFYFFNNTEVDTFSFMDTQVKPNTNYFYKVFQYTLVVAEEQTADDEGNISRDIKLSIVENLVGTTDALVTSKPPTYPEVDFRSFIGEEDKIQILFGDNNVELIEAPISLSQEETNSFNRIRSAQGASPGGKISFMNDDGIKIYEIFRTTTPPMNPLSFADKKWRRVLNTEILDKVSPDTTYYYMFRAIDNHGNISNPSRPYEVTLVGGISPYLIVNEFKYEDEKAKTHTKTKEFKKFLMIKPAFEQLLIDKIPEGLISSLDLSGVNKPTLGKVEPKVWGNKYKLRVTSKKTGKKIDFNLEYDYKFEFRDE